MHCTEMCLNTCFRKSNRVLVDKAGNLQCRDEPCFMSLIAIKNEMDSINKHFWLFNHTTGACYYTEDCSYATQANMTSRLYNPIFQPPTIWNLISSAMWSVPWSQSQFKSRWMIVVVWGVTRGVCGTSCCLMQRHTYHNLHGCRAPSTLPHCTLHFLLPLI